MQRGERRHQQHDGKARVAQDRHQRGDQYVEQHVAGQRREDHLDAGCLDDRLRRDRDPLQREHDEAEPDQHAPELADRIRLPGEEEHDADEDQQRRKPGQVERQDDRDQRRADVGAEHHCQRLRGADQTLPGERGDDQRRRGAALDQRGYPGAGEERVQRLGHADAQEPPQRAAEQPQDAGAHDVRAPDEQRYAGEEIEQRLHGGSSGFRPRPRRAPRRES